MAFLANSGRDGRADGHAAWPAHAPAAGAGRGGQDGFGHQAAAQDAGHCAQPRPGGVTRQPEARHADVARHGVLVGVVQGLADPADRPARPTSSAQCVEIITARWPGGALSVSPGADTDTKTSLTLL
jgi:hypothetical protein